MNIDDLQAIQERLQPYLGWPATLQSEVDRQRTKDLQTLLACVDELREALTALLWSDANAYAAARAMARRALGTTSPRE